MERDLGIRHKKEEQSEKEESRRVKLALKKTEYITPEITGKELYDTLQRLKERILKDWGSHLKIESGPKGSLFILSDAGPILDWEIKGKTDFDKFIKRYEIIGTDERGNEIAKYTMATRGNEKASKDVTTIVPEYKDNLGQKWLIFQEEARPIDILRNGKQSRILAFPAGIIADEIEDESAIESANRELTEETGLKAEKLTKLYNYGEIRTSPGLTDEATNYFKAEIKSLKLVNNALTDGGVTRGWHFVPIKKLAVWFDSMGKINKKPSGQTLSAIALMAINKGKQML